MPYGEVPFGSGGQPPYVGAPPQQMSYGGALPQQMPYGGAPLQQYNGGFQPGYGPPQAPIVTQPGGGPMPPGQPMGHPGKIIYVQTKFIYYI